MINPKNNLLIKNRISLDDILDKNINGSDVTIDELFELKLELDLIQDELNQKAETLDFLVKTKYATQINNERIDRPTGVIHLTDGDYRLDFTAPKRVELNTVAVELAKTFIAKNDFDKYIKTTYKMDETAFKNANDEVKKILAPTRTVKIGKETWKITKETEGKTDNGN